jgi:hypothetical protein
MKVAIRCKLVSKILDNYRLCFGRLDTRLNFPCNPGKHEELALIDNLKARLLLLFEIIRAEQH